MKKIIDWFYEPFPDLERILRFVVVVVAVMHIEVSIAIVCLGSFGVELASLLLSSYGKISSSDIIIWAAFEEFIYRFLPLTVYIEIAPISSVLRSPPRDFFAAW